MLVHQNVNILLGHAGRPAQRLAAVEKLPVTENVIAQTVFHPNFVITAANAKENQSRKMTATLT